MMNVVNLNVTNGMLMRFKIRIVSFFVLLLLMVNAAAEAQHLDRVEPLNWWTGMKNHNLQLLIKGKDIGNSKVFLQYDGVKLKAVHQADSPNYLFVDLYISDQAQPGSLNLKFDDPESGKFTYKYQLKAREKQRKRGVDPSDVVYLLTPDRFANGDKSNDSVAGLKDGLNRKSPNGRHGGDVRGIINHLDYLQNLGVTALWINPVLTNAMPHTSYHGYAITDFYHVDPRFGSNTLYKELADKLHARHMKLIMDMVFNHSGLKHWWVDNPPTKDWIHPYVKNNFAMNSISDPHIPDIESDSLQNGWFVPSMPDLNENNPFLANYLIQNSIWWIEYAGLDGIRMDTYPFNDQPFMKRWINRLQKEYPDFYVVGEAWYPDVAEESFWAGKDTTSEHSFNTRLPSVTDFPVCFTTHNVFSKDGSVQDLYSVLSKDFLYDRPNDNLVFLDNHDMDRFYYTIGQNLAKYKLAMTFLLTVRGIPEIYYGTEILMHGHGPDGVRRQDFPGGWKGDTRNAFTEAGRTPKEKQAFNYIRKLLQWRKNSPAITTGNLKHLMPHDNVYIYARNSAHETVLVILNNSAKSKNIDPDEYSKLTGPFKAGKDIISGKTFKAGDKLVVSGNQAMVLDINNR